MDKCDNGKKIWKCLLEYEEYDNKLFNAYYDIRIDLFTDSDDLYQHLYLYYNVYSKYFRKYIEMFDKNPPSVLNGIIKLRAEITEYGSRIKKLIDKIMNNKSKHYTIEKINIKKIWITDEEYTEEYFDRFHGEDRKNVLKYLVYLKNNEDKYSVEEYTETDLGNAMRILKKFLEGYVDRQNITISCVDTPILHTYDTIFGEHIPHDNISTCGKYLRYIKITIPKEKDERFNVYLLVQITGTTLNYLVVNNQVMANQFYSGQYYNALSIAEHSDIDTCPLIKKSTPLYYNPFYCPKPYRIKDILKFKTYDDIINFFIINAYIKNMHMYFLYDYELQPKAMNEFVYDITNEFMMLISRFYLKKLSLKF